MKMNNETKSRIALMARQCGKTDLTRAYFEAFLQSRDFSVA